MIIDSGETFVLAWEGEAAQALDFVRDPARALRRVSFLRALEAGAGGLRGALLVQLPVLGEVDLPFFSLLEPTADGARLIAQFLKGRRAWVEVDGTAQVRPAGAQGGAEIAFEFRFRAHLATPDADGWGAGAFEKMVRASAARTLARVARELPAGIRQAVDEERLSPDAPPRV